MDAETLYRQLGRIIEAMPDFSGFGPLTSEQLTWLGRAGALVAATGDIKAKVDFDFAARNMPGALRHDAAKQIALVLYACLGVAELAAPAGVQGSFIPVGSAFDAFAAVAKVLQTATSDIFIVDPYMDEVVLTDFAASVPAGVSLRLLSDQATAKSNLAAAATRWVGQYGAKHPLSLRLAAAKVLHDRAILVDGGVAWILTQSLKDFAKRSPAEIVRADDTAPLKIAAYEDIWLKASVVV